MFKEYKSKLAMLDRSLIICYSTPNYEKITNHFLKCLKDVFVVSTGICMKRDIPPPELMIRTGYKSDLWYYCLITKLKHLIDSLKDHSGKYDYYISSDCDIQFLPNNVEKWSELEEYIKNNNKDVYFMSEYPKGVNGGFYIICNRNLKTTIDFLTEIYEEMKITPYKNMPLGEQTLINNNLHKLNYGCIPNKYIIWGNQVYESESSLVHHAVIATDVEDKWSQMLEITRYLDEVKRWS